MKDLQDFFESMSAEEFGGLVKLIDKKSLNPNSTKKIFDYISDIYLTEKGVSETDISEDDLNKLYESFSINTSLYANILSGDMEIVSGRIKLTDSSSCSLSLTKKGIKSVEKMIKIKK